MNMKSAQYWDWSARWEMAPVWDWGLVLDVMRGRSVDCETGI